MKKTKLLHFNKKLLPRLETQPKTLEGPAQEFNPMASVNSFQKQESLRPQDLFSMLEALTKKTRLSTENEYEPRDRKVVVELPELEQGQELSNQTLKIWISEVCNKVVSCAFNMLSSDQLSYEQAKISCSEGILRNVVLLTEKYELSREQIKLINQDIEQNIVKYLKRKYPMTESTDVNKALDEAVKPIDKTEAQENDLLQKSDVVFTYREKGNYNDKIMTFLNWIMTEIDSKPIDSKPVNPKAHVQHKTVYEQFLDQISGLFENVYNQKWMNRKGRESIRGTSLPSRVDIEKPNELDYDEKYASSVKEYTHYLIGRKISKSVPIYTQQEIKEGYLMIKSPAILRILTKWCEELWKKFKVKNYFLDREENVRVQEKGGNVNTMFMWMKIPLNDLVENQKAKIQQFMAEIQENNFDQQTQLLRQELFENDGFYHVEKFEKVCGKFATKTVNNLHSYIVLYLNRLIHGLLTVSKELYENRLSTKARWTSAPDLITFSIGDLMRCKCSSKEREILMIYKELETLSETNSDIIKIIRVKNRLKLGTNDILINILFKQKYLCEIQLAVKSAQNKFIACSNQFNHYIYELGRTLFGPLTQLSSVWMSLDPRAGEYEYIIKNEQPKAHPQSVICSNGGRDHEFAAHIRPFICSNCNLAYSHTNYFWDHKRCTRQNCNYVICALCRLQSEDEDSLKRRLLGKNEKLLKACTEIVNRKRGEGRKLPTYGVCIPIMSKKIKIQMFKQIEHKKIKTIFGLKKGEQNEKEKVFLIDELIKRSSEKHFLKKYLVFQIPDVIGQGLIDITIDRAKKEYIIPQKVKDVYKKEKEIMSLIEEKLDDESIAIMKGSEEGMNKIKNLQLADNHLTNIEFITKNFPNLERLQLSRNQLNDIRTIADLKDIVKLNVRNNNIKELPDQICYLDHLEGLNIRNNQIAALPNNFGNLKLLEKLESDNNKISELPQSFRFLEKLKFINLSKNKLTSFPECIKGFPKLKELFLAKNKLTIIPDWIVDFKGTMITLDLSKTKASNFPKGIYSLTKLETLKIQSDHDRIEPEIANLTNLQELYIQMVNLKELPHEIFNLKKLETLEIEDCPMQELPDCLSEMTALKDFNLINNKLDHLSKQLTEMTNLRGLKIEGQNISQLCQEMGNLVNLRTLSLNNNKFKQFPSVILNFKKLYKLSVVGNQLKFIPDDILNELPDLQDIQMDKNELKTIPKSIKQVKKLKSITFEDNPNEFQPWILDVIDLCQKNAEGDIAFLKKTQSINREAIKKKLSSSPP